MLPQLYLNGARGYRLCGKPHLIFKDA